MLHIVIPAGEVYDSKNNLFVQVKEKSLSLEHSLVSISKWESKWQKPFLSNTTKKTNEELIDYIRCMTLTQNVDPMDYYRLGEKEIAQIRDYIDSPMTATTFSDKEKGGSRQIITAEIIYYWMIALNIPFECQKWHLNRLLTLIKVCNIKNAPAKKMSKGEILSRNRSLNEARKKMLHTTG